MKKIFCNNLIIIFACFSLIGCYSVAFFQSPKVLEKGKTEFSLGTSLVYNENSFSLYELFGNMRVGIGDNTDIGFRIFGKPPKDFEFLKENGSSDSCEGGCWLGLYIDGKYQVLEDPFYLSGVLGISYGYPFIISFYPSIVVGTERFYFVSRVIVYGPIGFWEQENKHAMISPGISVGFLIGNKLKFIPEIGFLYIMTDKDFIPTYYTSLGISF